MDTEATFSIGGWMPWMLTSDTRRGLWRRERSRLTIAPGSASILMPPFAGSLKCAVHRSRPSSRIEAHSIVRSCMAANKVTAVRLGWGGNRRSGTIEPPSSAGGFFL
jgi:hypothetical protein